MSKVAYNKITAISSADDVIQAKEVKLGQVYRLPLSKIQVAVVRIEHKKESKFDFVHFITEDGVTESLWRVAVEESLELIAEYPTWQEAVNSPEFKGEK